MNLTWEAVGVLAAVIGGVCSALAYVLSANMNRMRSEVLLSIQGKFDSLESKFEIKFETLQTKLVLTEVLKTRVEMLEQTVRDNDVGSDVAEALEQLRREIRSAADKK